MFWVLKMKFAFSHPSIDQTCFMKFLRKIRNRSMQRSLTWSITDSRTSAASSIAYQEKIVSRFLKSWKEITESNVTFITQTYQPRRGLKFKQGGCPTNSMWSSPRSPLEWASTKVMWDSLSITAYQRAWRDTSKNVAEEAEMARELIASYSIRTVIEKWMIFS